MSAHNTSPPDHVYLQSLMKAAIACGALTIQECRTMCVTWEASSPDVRTSLYSSWRTSLEARIAAKEAIKERSARLTLATLQAIPGHDEKANADANAHLAALRKSAVDDLASFPDRKCAIEDAVNCAGQYYWSIMTAIESVMNNAKDLQMDIRNELRVAIANAETLKKDICGLVAQQQVFLSQRDKSSFEKAAQLFESVQKATTHAVTSLNTLIASEDAITNVMFASLEDDVASIDGIDLSFLNQEMVDLGETVLVFGP